MTILKRIWAKLPVIIRAIILGELVVTVGLLPLELAMLGNLKLSPRVPWLLIPTALWLWLYWRFLGGAGWPRSTSAVRRDLLRATPVPAGTLVWALLAGGFGIIACLCLGLLTVTLTNTPARAFALGVDFHRYPWWTVASCLIAISVTAGMIEEAGFRGYMLTPIQRRHGWLIATAVSGLMFFFDHHISHAYATLSYLPFFVSISALHALLVRHTGSIRPSVILHSVFDLAVTPIMFGLVATGWLFSGEARVSRIATESCAFIVFTAASVLMFRARPALRVQP